MFVYTEQVYQLIDSLQIFSIVSYNTAQAKKNCFEMSLWFSWKIKQWTVTHSTNSELVWLTYDIHPNTYASLFPMAL